MAKWKAPQKARRDENEPEIFDVLRAYGFIVEPTDKPGDCIAGYRGRNYIVEVKNGPKAPLTKYQKDFIERWTGQHDILCSVEEAEEWCKMMRRF
ncbi:nuclease/hydrolyse [Octadecabacter Antarctic DB virus 2]|nr:nuclease/hydrolyse [Octadecabacter Antarctic DB virus 2]